MIVITMLNNMQYCVESSIDSIGDFVVKLGKYAEFIKVTHLFSTLDGPRDIDPTLLNITQIKTIEEL